MAKVVVITGGGTGIGAACARLTRRGRPGVYYRTARGAIAGGRR